MTSLNTLCYVPLLLCINSNPYTCDDSGRFVEFLTTFFVFQPVEMCTLNFHQNFKNSYLLLPFFVFQLGPVEMCTFNFHHKFQKSLFVVTIQAIGIRV